MDNDDDDKELTTNHKDQIENVILLKPEKGLEKILNFED